MKDKREIIREMAAELFEGGIKSAAEAMSAAEAAFDKGYRKYRRGAWLRDESYRGKNKEIFRCSECGHWQSTKKGDKKIFYMNYCPFCGSRMTSEER